MQRGPQNEVKKADHFQNRHKNLGWISNRPTKIDGISQMGHVLGVIPYPECSICKMIKRSVGEQSRNSIL